MKVCFIADVHVGNHKALGGATEAGLNERCRATLEVLSRAHGLALAEEDTEVLVVLGDTFDTDRPTPQMIAGVIDAMHVSYTDTTVVFMAGNHDRASGAEGDHALGPLSHVEGFEVVESAQAYCTSSGTVLAMLPYRPEPVASWLERELDAMLATLGHGHIDVVCAHFGIHDAEYRAANPWCVDSPGAVDVEFLFRVLKDRDIPLLVAGDWHQHMKWTRDGVTIMQVGALVPTGWDNPGLEGYGSLISHDPDDPEQLTRFDVRGPRFVTVRSAEEYDEAVTVAAEEEHDLYVRWKADPRNLAEAQRYAEMPEHAGFQIVLDEKVSQDIAQRAAAAARSQETLEQAAGAYVEGLTMQGTVTRPEVWALTRRCLDL